MDPEDAAERPHSHPRRLKWRWYRGSLPILQVDPLELLVNELLNPARFSPHLLGFGECSVQPHPWRSIRFGPRLAMAKFILDGFGKELFQGHPLRRRQGLGAPKRLLRYLNRCLHRSILPYLWLRSTFLPAARLPHPTVFFLFRCDYPACVRWILRDLRGGWQGRSSMREIGLR